MQSEAGESRENPWEIRGKSGEIRSGTEKSSCGKRGENKAAAHFEV